MCNNISFKFTCASDPCGTRADSSTTIKGSSSMCNMAMPIVLRQLLHIFQPAHTCSSETLTKPCCLYEQLAVIRRSALLAVVQAAMVTMAQQLLAG
jgi:hypothetical protein